MADSPISHHSGGVVDKVEEEGASLEQKAQMEQAYQQMQRKLRNGSKYSVIKCECNEMNALIFSPGEIVSIALLVVILIVLVRMK